MTFYLFTTLALSHSEHLEPLDKNPLLPHITSIFGPIAQSMNRIVSALTPMAASPKSIESVQSNSSAHSGESDSSNTSEGQRPKNHSQENPKPSLTLERRKRDPQPRKTKTTFRLAHPPTVRHKQCFHIRPKVILQLQQLSHTARPIPVLDVLPSVIFAPLLARRFPRTLKGKAGLGANDMVVLSSQDYHASEKANEEQTNSLEDDEWEARDVVAAICPGKRNDTVTSRDTEIALKDGSSWTASWLANGIYEFERVGERGQRTIARWVPRRPARRRDGSSITVRPAVFATEERTFAFSIINPNSRRHAIIATLNKDAIEVSHEYCQPSERAATGNSCYPQSPISPTVSDLQAHSAEIESTARHVIEVDEYTRNMILITGILVAFREGFSPNFSCGESSLGQADTNMNQKHGRLSLNIRNLGRNSMNDQASPKSRSTRASIQQTASSSIIPAFPPPPVPLLAPRRSLSTGSAFMKQVHSRKSSTQSNYLSPVISHDATDGEASYDQYRGTPPAQFTDNENLKNNLRTFTISKHSKHQEGSLANGEAFERPKGLGRFFGSHRRASGLSV